MRTKMAALLLSLTIMTPSMTSTAQAGLINGSFEQWTGGYNGATSELGYTGTGGYTGLTGWTLGQNTYGFLMSPGAADTTGSYSPYFNNTFYLWGSKNGGVATLPASSPDGGNYVVLDGGSGYQGTGISQVLTGLTKGQQYAVSFDWASGQQKGFDGATNESLQVTFGSQVQSTATVTNVSHGFTNWQRQTFVFTADGTSDTLNFLANGSLANGMPAGMPPMVLLDGVTFGAVPEPASLALVGLGLGLTVAVRRFRGKTTAEE